MKGRVLLAAVALAAREKETGAPRSAATVAPVAPVSAEVAATVGPRPSPVALASPAPDARAAAPDGASDGLSALGRIGVDVDKSRGTHSEPRDKAQPSGPRGVVKLEPLPIGRRAATDPIVVALRARAPAFKACYLRALRRNPTLAGDLTLTLKLAADGTVASASVARGKLGDDEVVACLEAICGRFRLPPPAAGAPTTTSTRLTFAPAD